MNLRDLPSVDELLRRDPLARLPRAAALQAARAALGEARLGAGVDVEARAVELAQAWAAPRIRPVLNATGVVLHTNLGRAPLPQAALDRVRATAGSYSNLELDLETGKRGSRHEHLAELLRLLTGAEDALVVNNNAAALLLALAALAEGRDVLVSRGELIEIGDGFRIPEILERSGARLVEVGTTNRTRLADYERALGDETALVLRVHQSNFRTVGFAEQPRLAELVSLPVPVLDDLGSGSFLTVEDEPLVPASVAAGAALVAFSGDKLLGGPQAGIVVGRAEHVEALRRHPLQRALRPDKLTLAALEGTLLLYLDPERARREVPILAALDEPVDAVRERAELLAGRLGGTVEETTARVGGGALPLHELASAACAVEPELQAELRRGDPPVVALLREGRTLLDCRTLRPAELDDVVRCVEAAREARR